MDRKTQLAQEFAKLSPIEDIMYEGLDFLPDTDDMVAGKAVVKAALEDLDFAQMEANVVAIAASVYTEDELEAIIAFSKTPEGASFISKQAQVLATTQFQNQQILAEHMQKPEVQARVEAVMDEYDI